MVMQTVFCRYLHNDTGAKMFAAQATDEDIEILRKHWTKDQIDVGDFIQIMPNGDIVVHNQTQFLETYHKPEMKTPRVLVEIDHQADE